MESPSCSRPAQNVLALNPGNSHAEQSERPMSAPSFPAWSSMLDCASDFTYKSCMLSLCSLVRKSFTVLHVFDTVTRAYVSPENWEAAPPAFGCASSLSKVLSVLETTNRSQLKPLWKL